MCLCVCVHCRAYGSPMHHEVPKRASSDFSRRLCTACPLTTHLPSILQVPCRGPSPLRECAGWGLFVCMLSMLAGGAVEMVRLSLFKQGHVLTDDKNAIVDMSVFWQIPQYILVGLSEVSHCTAC